MKDGQILIHKKGTEERLVPFRGKFRKVLQEYLQVRGQIDSDALFCTVGNTPVSKRQIQEQIQTFGLEAQVTGVRVSPHTFRYTIARRTLHRTSPLVHIEDEHFTALLQSRGFNTGNRLHENKGSIFLREVPPFTAIRS